MPFAGWNIGEYKLSAECKIFVESEQAFMKLEAERSFQVVKADPGDMNGAAMSEIISLYKSQVLEGPMRRYSAWNVYPPFWLSESMYGCFHNIRYSGTWVDPRNDFVCGGYQNQVSDFFSDLCFNSDPRIRRLMSGLDYGPIARGNVSGLSLIHLGAHHSVVLYPMGQEWLPILTYESIVHPDNPPGQIEMQRYSTPGPSKSLKYTL